MSAVIVRFCAAHDIISRIVRAGCYGFAFSHVEIVLTNGDAIGAHASTGVSVLPKGQRSPHAAFRQSLVIPCSAEQERACMAFLEAQLGKRYDFEAVAAIAASFFVGPRDWRSDDRWFCSELACAALEHAGIIGKVICEASRLTPRDLAIALSTRLEVITLPVEHQL